MNVIEAIERRRAYRSFEAVRITDELVEDLARSAQLAPSCFNYQPWKFVFVYDEEMLVKMREALSKGNEWVYAASLIIAVFGKREDDCNTQGREYYLFDMGQASAFLQLRATELGLVAHPIAGYSESKVKEILGIPDEYKVITLINVGKKSDKISPALSEKQIEWEKNRPERKRLQKFIFKNRFSFKAENKNQ
jgi:nitroreductase